MPKMIEGCSVFLLGAVLSVASPMGTNAQATYTLKPTPKTVAWGYYDAKAAPVLRVKSGDTVEIQTLITNSPKRLEDAGLPPEQVEQSLRDITELVDGNKSVHMMLPKSIFVGSAK
jgi:acetamidase/formamidase